RHHADDGAIGAVQCQDPSDDFRVAAEEALPQAVAQYHDIVAAVPVLSGSKRSPQCRIYPEHGEEVRSNARAIEAFGLGGGSEIEVGLFESGDLLEGAALRAPVGQIRVGR